MNIVEAMRLIAQQQHDVIMQQVRKYTGERYTVHTNAVGDMYHAYFPDDLIGQAAGEGHDLFEDTEIDAIILARELASLIPESELPLIGNTVRTIIELTDVYTSKSYPKVNRAERKTAERARLSTISQRAQNLKVIDLIDNTKSIVAHDPGFAKTYLREKRALLDVLELADTRLRQRAYQQVVANQLVTE